MGDASAASALKREMRVRAEIIADVEGWPWLVQSSYQHGEHVIVFARGPLAFRCSAVAAGSAEPCRYPVTPGRTRCRFHGGRWIRGSSPVMAPADKHLFDALLARKRSAPENDLRDIEEAIEMVGLERQIPFDSIWPPVEY